MPEQRYHKMGSCFVGPAYGDAIGLYRPSYTKMVNFDNNGTGFKHSCMGCRDNLFHPDLFISHSL